MQSTTLFRQTPIRNVERVEFLNVLQTSHRSPRNYKSRSLHTFLRNNFLTPKPLFKSRLFYLVLTSPIYTVSVLSINVALPPPHLVYYVGRHELFIKTNKTPVGRGLNEIQNSHIVSTSQDQSVASKDQSAVIFDESVILEALMRDEERRHGS